MTLTYRPAPIEAVPALTPPDHAWLIFLDGVMVGIAAGRRGYWAAGRIGPSRVAPVLPVTQGRSRDEAARRLVALC